MRGTAGSGDVSEHRPPLSVHTAISRTLRLVKSGFLSHCSSGLLRSWSKCWFELHVNTRSDGSDAVGAVLMWMKHRPESPSACPCLSLCLCLSAALCFAVCVRERETTREGDSVRVRVRVEGLTRRAGTCVTRVQVKTARRRCRRWTQRRGCDGAVTCRARGRSFRCGPAAVKCP